METCANCCGDIDPAVDTYTSYDGLYVCGACEEEAEAPAANTNCLSGMQCPACGAREPFRIAVATTVVMWDEGSDPAMVEGNIDWEDTAYCKCMGCDYEGIVTDFREPKPTQDSRPAAGPPSVYLVRNEEREILGLYASMREAHAFLHATVSDIVGEEPEGSEEWRQCWDLYEVLEVPIRLTEKETSHVAMPLL